VEGASAEGYRAPLFVAWQLTNRCTARCLACCEESGPDRAWADELTGSEASTLARRIVEAEIPYVAFGGGEPLGVPHCWELFDQLTGAGIALKIETDGRYIDDAVADRLVALGVQCVQISVDGATASTHERVRPGSSFSAATGAITRLSERGLAPELVFVPGCLNVHEAVASYELAAALGCSTFVTGPMMRIGRAAAHWHELACSDAAWEETVEALRRRAATLDFAPRLSIYPRDILGEMAQRLESPQAMLLVVPNGRVKLLNALPFAPADLRRDSLDRAWQVYRETWRSAEVRAFVSACQRDPALLRHANETWSPDEARERVRELLKAPGTVSPGPPISR
jgi:MoaA/NifB/PqqE/SkfB family radical SAM enzyme